MYFTFLLVNRKTLIRNASVINVHFFTSSLILITSLNKQLVWRFYYNAMD